jgi:hypothetical protein
MTKKTCHFCVYGRFCELLHIVLGFRGDLQGPWHCTCLSGRTKNSSFLRFRAIFMRYAHSFGVLGWFTRPMTLSTCLSDMTKNSSFLRLWPFLWAIAHNFGVRGWFTRPMTLSTCLRGMTKNSPFLCFRAVFVSYCPLFWGSWTFIRNMTVYTF